MREAAALMRQGWLMVRAAGRAEPLRAEGDRVVVFVHGFLAYGPVFDPMRRRVERELGLPTLGFSYGLRVPFDSICGRLEAFIEERVDPATTISLVAHSMGGLVARQYLLEGRGRERVDRLITLATPHGGTDSARFARGSLREALRPGGALLTRLGRVARTEEGVLPHVAIVAGRDRMVRPPSSAADVDQAAVHWLDDLGHNAILYDPRAEQIVIDALRGVAGEPIARID